MAKNPTKCDVCGGSTDGTPSGIKKHQATSKHTLANAAAAKLASAPKAVDVAVAPERFYADEDLRADLSNLIDRMEQELARRQIDLKWRERNRPAGVAADYAAAKVTPLKADIETLRQARKLLVIAGIFE